MSLDASRLPRHERDRIAQARTEVGETAVAPAVAATLLAAFACVLAAPHVLQLAFDPRFYAEVMAGAPSFAAPAPSGSGVERVLAANRELLASARRTEDRLADDSAMGRHVRPVVQGVMTGWLDAGTSQVEIGTGGWLFYRPDVDHVTGPGFLSSRALARRAAAGDTLSAAPEPDPRTAILALGDQLAARGVRLIVMPTPVKPSADPRRMGAGGMETPLVPNRSFGRFVSDLEAAGVTVFDPGRTLAALRREGEGPLYLATDTHWRPETMQRVASDLAASIEREVGLSVRTDAYLARRVRVTNEGDTARLLDLGPYRSRFPPQTVSARRVETTSGEAWSPDRTAEVLLLGDSFTNVYSLAALGWGTSAGLAEQLSYDLGRPVDRISQNDAGAVAPRRLLAAELARDADRLGGTRVVVYQFAARELSQGDWQPIELAVAREAEAGGEEPWSPGIDSRVTVDATLAAIASIPRPGSVPYRDHIAALHIVDIEVRSGPAAGRRGSAVVYVRSMIDNELTEAAEYAVGDRVRLMLEAWAGVAPELDGISRSELDDPGLLSAAPWWGVPAAGGP